MFIDARLWLLLLAAAASCSPTSSIEDESLGGLFGAAASHRVFVDNTFGGEDIFDQVSVVALVGSASEHSVVQFGTADRALTPDEKAAIQLALAPKDVVFVESVPAPQFGSDLHQAVVSFAEPELDGQGAVLTSNLWCGPTCGAGGAQRFEFTSDGWRFDRNVGPAWVS